MMKVLYLTNIEVPYRGRFFNEFAKLCDLTVMYERRKSANRDATWTRGEEKCYQVEYLDGRNIGDGNGKANSFSTRICEVVSRGWDAIIVGCYNSKVQMLAMLYMRIRRIPFYINLDGEPFIGTGWKAKAKSLFLKGAKGYLVAGENSRNSVMQVIGNKHFTPPRAVSDSKLVKPYYFSSLTLEEIRKNTSWSCERNNTILVIGRYFDYKGMDLAFQVASMDTSIRYKFVGMGNRTDLFVKDMGAMPSNIEIIPFLQKADLEEEYKHCAMLLLPTRQECWGLVINEAASFGMPIVSTWGSGAAVEFLADRYPCYLAKPNDAGALLACVKRCLASDNTAYSLFLKEKSRKYSIENSVEAHIKMLCRTS